MPEQWPTVSVDGHPISETWRAETVRVAIYGGDFNSIQAAINYAVTQTPTAANRWTVLVYPGTYGVFTMAQYVDVVGVDKESVIIAVTAGTAVTMANDTRIANVTINPLATGAGSAYGIETGDAGCRIEDLNMYLNRTAGAECVGIIENTGNTARDIYIRNVHIITDLVTNTNTHAISIRQANKTVHIEESYIQGSDYGMALGVSGGAAVASTIYSKQNFFQTTAAASRPVFNNGGNIYLHEDSIARGCRLSRENAGVILYTDGNEIYHVFEGMDIQNALDALTAAGGEVYVHEGTFTVTASIVMDSYQTLRGSGRSTIITAAGGMDLITATDGDGTEKVGILIKDLFLDGNSGTAWSGIVWTFVDHSKIENVWTHELGTSAVYLTTCDWNTISGLHSQEDNQGITLDTCCDNTIVKNQIYDPNDTCISVWSSDYNTIAENIAYSGWTYGIDVYSGRANIVSHNLCLENRTIGISFDEALYCTIEGNICVLNGQEGIRASSGAHNNVSNNTCLENSQLTDNVKSNIDIHSEEYTLVQGNTCRRGVLANQPQYGINLDDAACVKCIIQGNDLHDAGSTANFNDAGTLTIVQEDNREIGVPQVKRYVYMKNTSGGALAAGDVVVIKAVAAGDEFTTTVTKGDRHVLGMVAEAINNDAYGYVLIAGKAIVLSVSNDHGNIAIGDFLCCNDVATEGCLAAAGDTAFAIALEACTSAACTLDALLINPLTF